MVRRGSECSRRSERSGKGSAEERYAYQTGKNATLPPVLATPDRRKSEGDLEHAAVAFDESEPAPCKGGRKYLMYRKERVRHKNF